MKILAIRGCNLASLAGEFEIDLAGGALLWRAEGVVPDFRTFLTRGYNGGAWTGDGMTSTAARVDPQHIHALGYAPLNGGMLVQYTLYGDANLHESVASIDFNLLAANFSKSGESWINGDFNYDGRVDTLDFNLLGSNFSLSLPAPAASQVAVITPEPIGSSILIAPLVAQLCRGRRFPQKTR